VTPTMTIDPPAVGLLADVHASGGPTEEIVAMAAFTAVFNITGQPAVSLPLHRTASGLPVGVQCVAGLSREAQLLSVASQLEQAAPWSGLAPPSS
jgi:amidase